MNKFTIYCSEEQTILAMELGAPIDGDNVMIDEPNTIRYCRGESLYVYRKPTAEQMIGWIETSGLIQSITVELSDIDLSYGYSINDEDGIVIEYSSGFETRKEATMQVIDYALNYLKYNESRKR